MGKKITRIRLIEPKPAGYHVYSRVKLPRLGLPIMGTILKQKGYDVSIYCQDIQEIDAADIASADLVGISITTSTAPSGYHLADRCRQKGIPVVIGGPHATFVPEEVLQHADYCIRGEGEMSLPALADALSSDGDLSNIMGLSFIRDGEVHHNPDSTAVQDLDSLPIPDLTLIKGHQRIKITPIATSRGCPFNCTFCSVTAAFGRKYRYRSTANVIEELKLYQNRQVFFYDDNFTADRDRAKELCREMIRHNLTSGWTAQARVDVAEDEELLQLMHQSKCFMLYIGLESVNPETLKEFHKGQQVEQIERCIKKLHKYGIMVHGMFITGADKDTEQVVRHTTDFALANKIDTVQFSILTPFPGTELYRKLEEEQRIFSKDWSLYDGHHVVFDPGMMSPYALQKETFKAMERFYGWWQCLKLVMRLKFLSAFFRFYGNRQIKRWEASNSEFIARMKALGEKARSIQNGQQQRRFEEKR
jgi:radical SAM superfamily enzyme YgiQ (UPF0313 family)